MFLFMKQQMKIHMRKNAEKMGIQPQVGQVNLYLKMGTHLINLFQNCEWAGSKVTSQIRARG